MKTKKLFTGLLMCYILCCMSLQCIAASVSEHHGKELHSELNQGGFYTLPEEPVVSKAFYASTFIKTGPAKAMLMDANPQANPTSTQRTPVRHAHHVRNIIIIVLLVTVLYVSLAAAAK